MCNINVKKVIDLFVTAKKKHQFYIVNYNLIYLINFNEKWRTVKRMN